MLPRLQTQEIKPRSTTAAVVVHQRAAIAGHSAEENKPRLQDKMNRPQASELLSLIKQKRGFVLLEIVIALGLFSLVAVSLTQALDQIAKTSKIARDESRVMRVMESVLAQVAHRPELKEKAETFKSSADGVEATAEVKKIKLITQNKSELSHMFSIKVNAWITDGGTGKVLERSMETYVYSPNSKA